MKLPTGSSELAARARELRQEATTAEQLLWQALRSRRLRGQKFRRQHLIGRLITDFFCDDARLVIEIDGAIHQEATQKERDAVREVILTQHSLTVLRFTNQEVIQQMEQVLQDICKVLDCCSYASDSPSPAAWERGLGGEG